MGHRDVRSPTGSPAMLARSSSIPSADRTASPPTAAALPPSVDGSPFHPLRDGICAVPSHCTYDSPQSRTATQTKQKLRPPVRRPSGCKENRAKWRVVIGIGRRGSRETRVHFCANWHTRGGKLAGLNSLPLHALRALPGQEQRNTAKLRRKPLKAVSEELGLVPIRQRAGVHTSMGCTDVGNADLYYIRCRGWLSSAGVSRQ